MRNVLVQTIPAGSTLTVKINPPMEDGERHFILAPGGQHTAVVRVIDTGCVAITNSTESSALFILGVTRLPTITPEMNAMLASLFQRGQGPR